MARLGDPAEIVDLFAIINGSEYGSFLDPLYDRLGRVPEWIIPTLAAMTDRMLSASVRVLQACCTEDMSAVFGGWEDKGDHTEYQPGLMLREDIIIIASQLLLHGIIGRAKIRRLQRHESSETTNEFRAVEYINAARSHFGMSRDEASRLTMTEFQLLLAAKYPDQKGFTREEYDSVVDSYLERKKQRLAAHQVN